MITNLHTKHDSYLKDKKRHRKKQFINFVFLHRPSARLSSDSGMLIIKNLLKAAYMKMTLSFQSMFVA